MCCTKCFYRTIEVCWYFFIIPLFSLHSLPTTPIHVIPHNAHLLYCYAAALRDYSNICCARISLVLVRTCEGYFPWCSRVFSWSCIVRDSTVFISMYSYWYPHSVVFVCHQRVVRGHLIYVNSTNQTRRHAPTNFDSSGSEIMIPGVFLCRFLVYFMWAVLHLFVWNMNFYQWIPFIFVDTAAAWDECKTRGMFWIYL